MEFLTFNGIYHQLKIPKISAIQNKSVHIALITAQNLIFSHQNT